MESDCQSFAQIGYNLESNMNIKTISVASDFSLTPAGHYISDGPECRESFRDKILLPALTKYDKVIVDLDGIEGYGS